MDSYCVARGIYWWEDGGDGQRDHLRVGSSTPLDREAGWFKQLEHTPAWVHSVLFRISSYFLTFVSVPMPDKLGFRTIPIARQEYRKLWSFFWDSHWSIVDVTNVPHFGVQFKLVPQVPQMGYMWGTKSRPSTFSFFLLGFKSYFRGLRSKKSCYFASIIQLFHLLNWEYKFQIFEHFHFF